MNRFALILTTLVLAGSGLQAASDTEANTQLIDRLQDRLASLETRVMQLEAALEKVPPATTPTAPSTSIPKPQLPTSTPASQAELEKEKNLAAGSKASGQAEPAQAEWKNHLIGEGETISLIAKNHGIPREELMKANGLREGQQIYIGDSLRIPNPPKGGFVAQSAPEKKSPQTSSQTSPSTGSGGAVYTVRSGDTLMRIARNHSTTVASIKSANNLKTDFINVGQKLTIPGSSSSTQTVSDTSTKSEKPKSPTPGGNGAPQYREGETYGLYTVVKGDTLYSLARDFFTSPAEIQRLNELGESNSIRPGQDLVVPTSKYNEVHKTQNQLAGR